MTPDEIEQKILQHLDTATAMKLDLSDDESVYDLNYITKKVSQCSAYQEKLSNIMMELTRISIPVTNEAARTLNAVKGLQDDLKGSEEYKETPLQDKTGWLSNRLKEARRAAERWAELKSGVSQVKEAVAERAATMKRLDSDLRLQSKLFEARVAAGATPPPTFRGEPSEEIDLN